MTSPTSSCGVSMIEEYHPFTQDLDLMIARKNASYGDSVGKSAQMLAVVCPNGIPSKIFHRAHLLIRIMDKVCRLFSPTITTNEAIDAWKDIAGYSRLAIGLEERQEMISD